jgi:hypothetical protein
VTCSAYLSPTRDHSSPPHSPYTSPPGSPQSPPEHSPPPRGNDLVATPGAGRVYLWALGGIFTTATIMAAIRWHEDAHLFAIAVVAFSLSASRGQVVGCDPSTAESMRFD